MKANWDIFEALATFVACLVATMFLVAFNRWLWPIATVGLFLFIRREHMKENDGQERP